MASQDLLHGRSRHTEFAQFSLPLPQGFALLPICSVGHETLRASSLVLNNCSDTILTATLLKNIGKPQTGEFNFYMTGKAFLNLVTPSAFCSSSKPFSIHSEASFSPSCGAKQPRTGVYRLATDSCQDQVKPLNPSVASQSNTPTPQLQLLKLDGTYLTRAACKGGFDWFLGSWTCMCQKIKNNPNNPLALGIKHHIR